MFDKIDKIISERKLTPSTCDYHTLRALENNGKIRALVIKGETTVHIEMICPKCGNTVKVEKLKGGPKQKQ